jgi:WhiB family redox-sensing transcriptional regulator
MSRPKRPIIAVVPAGWERHAACQPYPLAMFFPVSSDDAGMALDVCETCPVREPCLIDALANAGAGVRGGLTAQQRGWLELRNGVVVAKHGSPADESVPRRLKPCGTQAAYTRHLRRGETPCGLCRRAHSLRRDVA